MSKKYATYKDLEKLANVTGTPVSSLNKYATINQIRNDSKFKNLNVTTATNNTKYAPLNTISVKMQEIRTVVNTNMDSLQRDETGVIDVFIDLGEGVNDTKYKLYRLQNEAGEYQDNWKETDQIIKIPATISNNIKGFRFQCFIMDRAGNLNPWRVSPVLIKFGASSTPIYNLLSPVQTPLYYAGTKKNYFRLANTSNIQSIHLGNHTTIDIGF